MKEHTQKALEFHEWFDYDPETGDLRWKRNSNNGQKLAGKRAGTQGKCGYWFVSCRNRPYRQHRVIWCMMTGEWPGQQIDHVNGDPGDNRWCNLRIADVLQQAQNRRTQKSNKSGHKGVSWSKSAKKWQAVICAGNKRHFLGFFADKEEAAKAYRVAAATLHGAYANYG